jgi:hypothetical protein
MSTPRPDLYQAFGSYSTSDARRLLDAFVEADVDFAIDMERKAGVDLDPGTAAFGGGFGGGPDIAIGVHIDDVPRATHIRSRVLKILP